MERNDIFSYESIGQATMFEGVLASPPTTFGKTLRERLSKRTNDWDTVFKLWTPHDLPLKSLSDCVNRLHIGTEVFTFLPEEAVDAINRWLVRKAISVAVTSYPDVGTLAYDLRFNRGIKVIYTSSTQDAQVLGLRSTVVSNTQAWHI